MDEKLYDDRFSVAALGLIRSIKLIITQPFLFYPALFDFVRNT
jgi:hypothetical protein